MPEGGLMNEQKEFFGMKYPFKRCARPVLLKRKSCRDCSVKQFCEAPEKEVLQGESSYRL